MYMTPSVRKLALTAHVVCSVGVLGSIAAFLVLVVTGLSTQDTEVIRAAYLSMDVLSKVIIVPLALASLVSGLVQSLGTPWGLFRHYWIVAKLVITSFATAVLLAKLKLIGYAATLALETDLPLTELRAAGTELVVHAAGGLLVLLIPAALSVYKPRGLTPYGRRKQQEIAQATPPQPAASFQPPVVKDAPNRAITFTLRRSQVVGGFVVVVVLHVLILHAAGTGFSMH